MKKKALIILADGFEEIEAISCIDVLRRAGIKVVVAGIKKILVTSSHDVTIKADIRLKDFKGIPHAIICPGGMPGATNLAASRKLISLIKKSYAQGKIVAAICAAPAFVLPAAGLHKGRRLTCYPGCEVRLKEAKFQKKSVVVDKNLITSRGAGTAIEFALAIVAQLVGKQKADEVGKRMLVN